MKGAVELQRRWAERWPQAGSEALADAERAGLSVLGLGGARICVRAEREDQVLKLAWAERGLADNVIETRVWEWAEPALRELLCPVIALEPEGILRQARCLPAAAEALGRRGEEVCRRLAAHGISDCAANLGLFLDVERGGAWRVVCYDFCLLRPQLAAELLAE